MINKIKGKRKNEDKEEANDLNLNFLTIKTKREKSIYKLIVRFFLFNNAK